jgi:hypothetical protein
VTQCAIYNYILYISIYDINMCVCDCLCVCVIICDIMCLMSFDVHQVFGASPCSPGHARPSAGQVG